MKDDEGRWVVQKPHKLFDYIREMYNLKTDAELANILSARTPMISRVRNGAVRMTPKLILEIHKQTKMPVEKIEEMAR
jgi:antitoxin component HigA of HigAB toxin-antitoxin module